MAINVKRTVPLIFLLVASLFAAGCVEENKEVPAIEGSSVVEVTDLAGINKALQTGPVFLKLGAEWCGPCQQMKSIMAEMSIEYEGRATLISVDVDNSPHLASYFGVYNIPDSCVIVGLEDGEYLYMGLDGNVTADRFQARIVGLREKEVFENVLEQALLLEGNSKAEEAESEEAEAGQLEAEEAESEEAESEEAESEHPEP